MLKTLKAKRAQLLKEATGFRAADGTFKDEAARLACEANVAECETTTTQILAIETAARGAGVAIEDDGDDEPTTPLNETQIRAAAATAELERGKAIRLAVRGAKLDDTFAEELVNNRTPIDKARALILDKLAAGDAGTKTDPTILIAGEDARDKFVRGATNWLLVKGGVTELVARAENPEKPATVKFEPGEFRGMTLVDLAKCSLERHNVQTRGLDKMRLVAEAFTYRSAITQSTSDFAVLLENVMHKVLQAAYATQPDTWRKFCNTGTVSDFRKHNRYRMGMFGVLDSLNENGEFKNKAILDGEKATIQAATKGNIINVSRQMIVNDDMGSFTRLLSMLGRAAGLTVEVDVYALLTAAAGLGVNTDDGVALFNAAHNNISVGAAFSVNALDADRVVLASQKDPNGNEYIDLRPHVLLVPIGIGGQARVTNEGQYDVDASNKFQVPNKSRGLFQVIVDSPRLSGTRRYIFANPAIAPVLEVAFLEGQTEPVLESRDGWRTDGAEMKVRFDYGVAAVDFRGAVTNAGA
jgi:hypothetical protein